MKKELLTEMSSVFYAYFWDMKLNQKLFNLSKNHPEEILDMNYIIVKEHHELQEIYNSAVVFTKRLIEFKDSHLNRDNILDSIINNWGNYISYIPFGGFINACGSNRDAVGKDKVLLNRIIELYIENRNIENPRKSEIQSSIDRGTSRRKGNLGRIKLEEILTNADYIKQTSLDDLIRLEKGYGICTKNHFNLNQLRSKLNIEISSAMKSQEKQLDFVIKNHNKYYILEQKNMGVSGGGQDKQIKELIEVISNTEKKNKDVFYISFIDGRYFQDVLLSEAPKNIQQVIDIEKALYSTDNFWLNTAGFKSFLEIINYGE